AAPRRDERLHAAAQALGLRRCSAGAPRLRAPISTHPRACPRPKILDIPSRYASGFRAAGHPASASISARSLRAAPVEHPLMLASGSPMRVLAVGATGFIGGHAARRLREAGHEVTALVRSRARAESDPRLAGMELVAGALADLPGAVDGRRFDVLLFAAGA